MDISTFAPGNRETGTLHRDTAGALCVGDTSPVPPAPARSGMGSMLAVSVG